LDTPQEYQAPSPKFQVSWQVIIMLVFNICMILLTLVTVLLTLTTGVGELVNLTAGMVSITPIFMLAGGLLFCASLLLPSTFLAGLRALGKPFEGKYRISEKTLIIILLVSGLIVLPVTLVCGELVSHNQQISWLLLPPLHVIAASIPVAWLVFLGLRGLNIGSSLRKWSVFGAGLVYAPNLILVAEISVCIVGFFALVIVLSTNPAWMDELLSLGQRLRYSAANPEILRRVLEPYLLHPMSIFSVFISVSVVVPLIEETIKPAGMWLLAGQRLTPAQGLALGLLSGAGYALFENLFLAASDVDWGATVLARAGTTGVHVLAAGLTGWGLASAWSNKKFYRLGINFSLAVLLHGLWNGLVIFYVGLTIFPDALNLPLGAAAMQNLVLIVLVLLALFTFAAIVGLNWRMQKIAKEEQAQENPLSVVSTEADLLRDEFQGEAAQSDLTSSDEGKGNGIYSELD
jgi:hypothetical protein